MTLFSEYQPKFFTKTELEILEKVIEVMIDAPAAPAIPYKIVAQRMDNLLDGIQSPAANNMSQMLRVVNWLLPLQVASLRKFVNLSKEKRKRSIEKIIMKKGVFRDIARGLKVLSTVAYYSSTEGHKEVGYIDFDDRASTVGKNQDLTIHPNIDFP